MTTAEQNRLLREALESTRAALLDAIQDLEDWKDDNEEPGQPFLATEAILTAARAATANAAKVLHATTT